MPRGANRPLKKNNTRRFLKNIFCKRNGCYVLSFLSLIVISFLLYWMATIGLFNNNLGSLLNWAKRTTSPYLALYFVILTFTCILWIFLTAAQGLRNQSGSFSVLMNFLQSIKPAFSLPIHMLLSFLAFSLLILFLLRPQCEPPLVKFEGSILGEPITIGPQTTVSADRGSMITIIALPQIEEEGISCEWTTRGDIFQRQQPNSTCVTTILLNDIVGNGIVTVEATKDWCDAKSVIPIFVIAK